MEYASYVIVMGCGDLDMFCARNWRLYKVLDLAKRRQAGNHRFDGRVS